MANKDYQRKQFLREFYQRSNELLTEEDKNYLYDVLKEYQSYKQVDKLVQCLNSALDTPEKKDLLHEIRNLIPLSHLHEFDRVAPYHEMRHPIRPSTNHIQKKKRQRTMDGRGQRGMWTKNKLNLSDLPIQRAVSTASLPLHGQTLREDPGLFKVITINKENDEELGLSIRGGKEHGLGIYVSDVEEVSLADDAGLEVGDNIVEVNNVSFDSIASSSAIKVFAGSNRLRIVIRRTGKVPGSKYSKEKVSWYDTSMGSIIEGQFDDSCSNGFTSGMPMLNGLAERRVNLTINSQDDFLGFNIRGGSEYNLGVYVSKIDEGGLAQLKGIRMGDQIVDVNGHSFEDISHTEAVGFLKTQKQLMLTVREVGRYPMYKMMYAEYNWVEGEMLKRQRDFPKYNQRTPWRYAKSGIAGKKRYQPRFTKGPSTAPPSQLLLGNKFVDNHFISEGTVAQFPMESRVEVFTQTTAGDRPMDMAIQTEQVFHDKATLALAAELSIDEPIIISKDINLRNSNITLPPGINNIAPTGDNFRKRSHSIDVGAGNPIPAISNNAMVVRRRSSTDVGGSMQLPQVIQPVSVDFLKSSVDNALGDSVERSYFENRESLGDSLIEPDINHMLTSSLPTQLDDSKSQMSQLQVPLPGQEIEEKNKENKGDKKVKRSKTFKEMLFRKKSFNKKDKEKSSEGKVKSKSKLGGFSIRKKTKDDDNKSRKSSSSDSSGKKADDDGGSTLSSGKSMYWRQKGSFEYGAGTQMMLGDTAQHPALAMVLDLAKKLLNDDETNAVMRHIKKYHDTDNVEALVAPLMAILDKPEKMLLLREIRDVISPTDLGRFDSMVSHQEMRAYEELAARMSELSAVIMSRGKPDYGPPRKTLMASIPDHRGNFRLKTQEEHEKDRERRQELERKQREISQKFRREKLSDSCEHIPFPNLYAKEEALNLAIDDLKIMESQADAKDGVQVEEADNHDDEEPLYATVDYRRKKRSMSLNDDSLRLSLKGEDATEGLEDLSKMWTLPIMASTPAPGQPASPPKSILKNERSNLRKSLNWDNSTISDAEDAGESSGAESRTLETVVESHEEEDEKSPSRNVGKPPVTPPVLPKMKTFEFTLEDSGLSMNSIAASTELSKSDSHLDSNSSEHEYEYLNKFRMTGKKSEMADYDLETQTLHNKKRNGRDGHTGDSEENGVLLVGVKKQNDVELEDIYASVPGTGFNKNISQQAKFTRPVFHAPPPPSSPPPPLPTSPPPALPKTAPPTVTSDTSRGGMITVELSKNRASLGISISGGSDSDKQPEVKVEKVFPHGAAREDERIKAGMQMYSVDGEVLIDSTHHEAVDLIRRVYNNKKSSTMTLVLIP